MLIFQNRTIYLAKKDMCDYNERVFVLNGRNISEHLLASKRSNFHTVDLY